MWFFFEHFLPTGVTDGFSNNKLMRGSFMKRIKVVFTIYLVIVLGLLGAALAFSVGLGCRDTEVLEFESDWETPEGTFIRLDKLPPASEGMVYEVTKKLPEKLKIGDQLNFISQNIYFEVRIDGQEVYKYRPGENITGAGYGSQGHYIGIPHGAKEIKIIYEKIFPHDKSGRFNDVCISSTNAYLSMELKSRGLNLALSVIIIFLGMTLFVIYIGAKGLHVTTYNVPALALSVVMIGLWTSSSASFLQLLIDNPLVFRYIDYIVISLISYPMVVFFSTAAHKRYVGLEIISLVTAIGCTGTMFIGRFVFGQDMHNINFLDMTSMLVGLAIAVLIMIFDIRVTIKKKNYREHLLFYLATGLFVVGALAETIVYFMFGKEAKNGVVYLQMGMILFIILMMTQILRAMLREHISFDQQVFVNDLIKYSLSDMEPEDTINHMLKYLVDELNVDRAYIFEENEHGTTDNTYECCRKGVKPFIDALKDLPYEDFMETWYSEFEKSKTIVIEDIEEYRSVNENIYKKLSLQDIRSVVCAPLEHEGQVFGFIGVDNPPARSVGNIRRIINLLEYFTCTLIRQRDNNKLLFRYSYVDSLTGVMNRRSLDEMIEEKLENSESYGVVMCDINGLKNANDTQGHLVGDMMIQDVARSLAALYGQERVFRMGGDEFLVVSFDDSKEQFEKTAAKIKPLVEAKGENVSIGTAYCAVKGMSFNSVMKLADSRMYEDKTQYYMSHGDRRR